MGRPRPRGGRLATCLRPPPDPRSSDQPMRNASNREKVAGGRRTGGRRPARRLPHWPLLAAAVAMYLGASLLLVGTQSHPFRPLFEGVGPPPAYRWVKPPGPFAGNNVPPHPSEQDIRL